MEHKPKVVISKISLSLSLGGCDFIGEDLVRTLAKIEVFDQSANKVTLTPAIWEGLSITSKIPLVLAARRKLKAFLRKSKTDAILRDSLPYFSKNGSFLVFSLIPKEDQ